MPDGPESGSPPENTGHESGEAPDAGGNEGYTPADSLFSAPWDPEGSMDPFTGTSAKNCSLFSLIYEGLFRLSPSLTPQPVLCESCTTEDGMTFTLRLKSGIAFQDGSVLSAEDAVYSLLRAAEPDSRYASRFSSLQSAQAEEDGLTFTLTLSEPNYAFPALLDIPIVKSGAAEGSSPVGTGPYIPRLSGAAPCLEAFSGHRDRASLPVAAIYLRDTEDSALARAFSQRLVDILDRDPLSAVEVNLHSTFETRYYDTTGFIYIGFNTAKGPMSDGALRRVVASVPNLDRLCERELKGAVRRAVLPVSPALPYYNEAWEALYSGPVGGDFTSLASAARLIDGDNDGRWDTTQKLSSIKIRFIVNTENPSRLAAARTIVSELGFMGFEVTLAELSYQNYLSALAAGDFDMYLGEVKLTADMDLSALLSSGGSLNFGSAGGYDDLLAALRAAPDDRARAEAAEALCRYAAGDTAILPIAYKRNMVLTHPGVVSGLSPSLSGIYADIADWTINIEEDAK